MDRGQDALLLPMIVDCLSQAGVAFDALDRIAATRGPGSFTGVRVCLAAARGLGMALNKPVLGINRFDLYRGMDDSGDALVVIQSKRAELFCRFYPVKGQAESPQLMTEEQIAIFLKDNPSVHRVDEKADLSIIEICSHMAAQAPSDHPDFQPTPLYLRAPDVTQPKAR